jgi:hypothetical protein
LAPNSILGSLAEDGLRFDESKPVTLVREERAQAPWMAVWISPRQTIDRVLASRLRLLVLPLASRGGASLLVGKSLILGWTYQVINWWILLFDVVVGATLGIVSTYLNSFVLSRLGQSLGGRGSAFELRVATAWSWLPGIFGFLVVVMLLVISRAFDHTNLFVPSGLLALMQAVLTIGNLWSLAVFLAMISQVHQFSLTVGHSHLCDRIGIDHCDCVSNACRFGRSLQYSARALQHRSLSSALPGLAFWPNVRRKAA